MTVLLSSCGIIMYFEINAPGHGKNVIDGLDATDKCYFKEQITNTVRIYRKIK